MLAVGRFSNDSGTVGDKRANVCTRTHEHTVSRPDVDPHAGIYTYEFTHCHSNTDFGAVGNGYTNPDGHTFSNTGPNSDECSNSHINSRDVSDIVAYTYADGTNPRLSRPTLPHRLPLLPRHARRIPLRQVMKAG